MSSSPFPVVVAVERSRRIMLAFSVLMLVVGVATIASGGISGVVLGGVYVGVFGYVAWRTRKAYSVHVSADRLELVRIFGRRIIPIGALAGARTAPHHIMGRKMVVVELSFADGSVRKLETINQLPKLDAGPASEAAGWINRAIASRSQGPS